MMRVGIVIVAVGLAIASTTYAQPAAPAPWVPQQTGRDAVLEQSVADELAAKGTPLSRAGVTLHLETLGNQLVISLVDATGPRVVSDVRIPVPQGDREAVIAALVPVAANLLQRLQSGERPNAEVEAERAERERRDSAERTYRAQAILFEDEVQGQQRSWVAYQGEVHRRLEGADFYTALGRADLASAYDRRRVLKWGLVIGGMVVMGVGAYISTVYGLPERSPFDERGPVDEGYFYGGLAVTMGGLAIALGGAYLAFRPHPISENEAKDLAASHNAELRKQLGLPGRQARIHRGRFRDVAVVPYVDHASGGGVALTGRF